MKLNKFIATFLIIVLSYGMPVYANNNETKMRDIRQTLVNAGLTMPVESIELSEIKNLYKINIKDNQNNPMTLYIDDSMNYIIQGELVLNPSPITPIHIPHGKTGTPLTIEYKTALLKNMSELTAVNENTPFYYTALNGMIWSIADGMPFLISSDGKYTIDGEISVIKNGQFMGLDQEFERTKNRHIFDVLDKNELITYQANNQKTEMYIATDIHCPYCRLFHSRINELNTKGITVHVIGYVVYEESAEPMRQIWCESSHQRQALLNKAMQGIMPNNQCHHSKNNLLKNYLLAQGLAVAATPAIYDADGTLFEGDFRGDELIRFLGI